MKASRLWLSYSFLGLMGVSASACSSDEQSGAATGGQSATGGTAAEAGAVGSGGASTGGDTAATGGSSGPGEAGGAGGGANGSLEFGAVCTVDAECAEGSCVEFGDGTLHCTMTCSVNDDCPEGAQGRKCNGRGFCAY